MVHTVDKNNSLLERTAKKAMSIRESQVSAKARRGRTLSANRTVIIHPRMGAH